jgi:hypothetical protein
MSLITGHWSASGPNFLNDYHVEFFKKPGTDVSHISLDIEPDFNEILNLFAIQKNDDLGTPTDFGTWHLNHDPRDGSPNIEIGALCMANATTQNWGLYPFTPAHAWMMAAIIARVAQLKHVDTGGSFDSSVESSVLMNGPIFDVSTHAERAFQTQNPGVDHPERGYFIFSGDPDCRWDLTVLDPAAVGEIANFNSAIAAAKISAAWIREKAHAIKAAGIHDFWGLDH